MDNWKVIKQEVVLDHPWVKLVVDTLERNGRSKPHYYLESPTEPVGVVALTADNQLIVTRQYRHPVGRVIYDLPGGRTNPGEDLLVAARRELKEETGYSAGHIESLGTIMPFPGSLRVALNLFIALDLTLGPQQLDPGEELEVHHLPFAEVYTAVLAGEYIDGALQTGVLLARARGFI
jgi:ADP-ribose pyrophosphatase